MSRHGEVLAQHRQAAGGAGDLQVGHRAAEELDVGEHAEARRPAALVLARQHGRIEPDVQVTLRRRTPLDLADDVQRARLAQRRSEPADGQLRTRLLDELVERANIGCGLCR